MQPLCNPLLQKLPGITLSTSNFSPHRCRSSHPYCHQCQKQRSPPLLSFSATSALFHFTHAATPLFATVTKTAGWRPNNSYFGLPSLPRASRGAMCSRGAAHSSFEGSGIFDENNLRERCTLLTPKHAPSPVSLFTKNYKLTTNNCSPSGGHPAVCRP